jgi:hypothetical protein
VPAAVGLLLIITPAPAVADDKYELTDSELNAVVGGGERASEQDSESSFEYSRTTRSGRLIEVDGSFKLVDPADVSMLTGLLLSGNAQQNLSSLININAVNSNINVLLNLNINIDSNVENLNQSNANGIRAITQAAKLRAGR